MLNEAINQLKLSKRKTYLLPSTFPSHRHEYVIEVENSHTGRLLSILTECLSGLTPITVASVAERSSSTSNQQLASLIFCEFNPAQQNMQLECLKYISRIFHVPITCVNPVVSILNNKTIVNLIADERVTFKLQTSPISLSDFLIESLCCEGEGTSSIKASRFKAGGAASHMIQIVYCESDGLFRWGVVSAKEANVKMLTFVSILQRVQSNRAESLIPVCRAYWKIQELIEYYFILWGWQHCLPFKIVVDVGASPGRPPAH